MNTIKLYFYDFLIKLQSVSVNKKNRTLQGYNTEDQVASITRLSNPEMIGSSVFETLALAGLYKDAASAEFALEQKIVSDVAFFHSKKLGTDLVATYFKGDVGAEYTNLQTFIRPQDETSIITSIRFFTAATVAAVNAEPYTAGLSAASLVNGTFSISSNNNTVLKDYPMIESQSSAEQFAAGIIILEKPIIWASQQNFNVTVTLPVAAAANTSLMVELRGIGLI